ncbi:MAG TPA: gamma-glutamyl-gamma-aminobutyrate hydrolase family protein [Streptosporangiaceae bacterium]
MTLVGISSYGEEARWGPWRMPCALLPLSYAEQVAAAGGVPVLLPPLPGMSAAVGRLDALILSGGGDLDPAGYGAAPHPETTRVHPGRDRAELDLLAAALAARVPVLGICRGLQIINTARGGTLRQHLPEGGHRAGPGTFGSHPVRVAPGSRLASLLGPPDDGGELWLDVPTAHHQAIGELGDGLVATAWAADGTIEAVEPADRDEPLIAVQWHPEQGTDPRLFRGLLAAARQRADGSANRAPAEPLDSPA